MPFWFEVVLAASGASYQGVQGAYGCNFSWGSTVNPYHRFVPIGRKNRPLSSIQFIISEKFIGSFVDTGEQFIGGVVDTGEQLLAVL
jgi:hypothetical protein